MTHAVAKCATFRRFRTTLPSAVPLAAAVFSSPVSAPLPRTRERVRLRDFDDTKISTESILATDGGLRPRALGDEGGDVALPPDDDAALRGLASERRLCREEARVAVAATAGALALLLLTPPSLSCCSERGTWTRTRDRERPCPPPGIDVDVAAAAAAISALGFGARAFPLPLPLLLLFEPSTPSPRAISAMPVSFVPSIPPSSSSPSPSLAVGRARLARPLVLAPARALRFTLESRARIL